MQDYGVILGLALLRGLNLKCVSTKVSLGHLKFKRQENTDLKINTFDWSEILIKGQKQQKTALIREWWLFCIVKLLLIYRGAHIQRD